MWAVERGCVAWYSVTRQYFPLARVPSEDRELSVSKCHPEYSQERLRLG